MSLHALRRIALSSARCCTLIRRRGRGADDGISEILNSDSALTAIITTALRLKASDVRRLIGSNVEAAPAPTPNELEHVRSMHTQG